MKNENQNQAQILKLETALEQLERNPRLMIEFDDTEGREFKTLPFFITNEFVDPIKASIQDKLKELN